MAPSTLGFLLNAFSLSTILLVGALLQSLLHIFLPLRYAMLPAAFLLLLRISDTALVSYGFKHNSYEDPIKRDKWTAQVPEHDGVPQKASDKGVVVFLIGAASNHPAGPFAPGFKTTGDYFRDMFVEIEADAAKWGYLGRSNPLIELNPSGTFTTLTVSYWASIEHLHAFAHGASHREGWAWWDHYRQSHHDVGIYHETYFAPSGNWETIYENMHPFGMGKIRFPVNKPLKLEAEQQQQPSSPRPPPPRVSGLVPARDVKWRGMANRMARGMSGIAAPAQ